MPSWARSKPARARSVFINCPFDAEYKPLFRAVCFTILACGYVPRCALDYSDSGAVRFTEIVKMITECGLSIHDISRVQLDKDSSLPRFNMPLELGADLGLRLEGPARQRDRKILILYGRTSRYMMLFSLAKITHFSPAYHLCRPLLSAASAYFADAGSKALRQT